MFLFAGTHYLKDLSRVNWSEIFINVKTLHISFLEKEDSRRLLTEPVPRLKYKNQDLIEQILDETGCQPYLLQAVASELVNILNFRNTDTVTQKILDEAVNQVLNNYSSYFDYIWETECTTSTHKKLLKIVAVKQLSKSNFRLPGWFSRRNNIGYLKTNQKLFGIPKNELTDYYNELRDLIGKEVLKVEDETVKLTMPIVRLWMKKNHHIL
jgi:hypothetical protein